jgi:hypothetical protein
MCAERYILVTEDTRKTDVGRDAETDVAIEDDGMEEDGGAVDGESRIGWDVGDGFVDGDHESGTSAGDGTVHNDDDTEEDHHYVVQDWPIGTGNV